MSMKDLLHNRIVRVFSLSIFVSFGIALCPSIVTPTLSCPGPPPQTLRMLYVQSSEIVIAHVGKTEVTKTISDGEDESVISHLRTALLVSSTLKGESQPVVYVNHVMYQDYKDRLSAATEDKNLLVFLFKEPESEDYSVDMNYGLKELSDADLAVYVSRISELASIMKGGTPSDTAMVEWLVRCAEESATRWEGSYELTMSQYMLDQQRDNVPSEELPSSESENTDETGRAQEEFVVFDSGFGSEWAGNPNYARLMTTEQKYRLVTTLTSIVELASSDLQLLNLVQSWDDQRLVPYLLAQLDRISKPGHEMHYEGYYTNTLMRIVADKLGDDALSAFVKRFNDNEYEDVQSYDDDDDYESSEDNENVSEKSPEQEAADEAAAELRRSADLQYFVTLALSTVPNTPNEVPSNPDVPAEP